jgi:hypothetical protein
VSSRLCYTAPPPAPTPSPAPVRSSMLTPLPLSHPLPTYRLHCTPETSLLHPYHLCSYKSSMPTLHNVPSPPSPPHLRPNPKLERARRLAILEERVTHQRLASHVIRRTLGHIGVVTEVPGGGREGGEKDGQ